VHSNQLYPGIANHLWTLTTLWIVRALWIRTTLDWLLSVDCWELLGYHTIIRPGIIRPNRHEHYFVVILAWLWKFPDLNARYYQTVVDHNGQLLYLLSFWLLRLFVTISGLVLILSPLISVVIVGCTTIRVWPLTTPSPKKMEWNFPADILIFPNKSLVKKKSNEKMKWANLKKIQIFKIINCFSVKHTGL